MCVFVYFRVECMVLKGVNHVVPLTMWLLVEIEDFWAEIVWTVWRFLWRNDLNRCHVLFYRVCFFCSLNWMIYVKWSRVFCRVLVLMFVIGIARLLLVSCRISGCFCWLKSLALSIHSQIVPLTASGFSFCVFFFCLFVKFCCVLLNFGWRLRFWPIDAFWCSNVCIYFNITLIFEFGLRVRACFSFVNHK